MSADQSYKHHSRWDPVYHFFVLPILLLNIIMVGLWYGNHRHEHAHIGAWAILVSVALFMLALKARVYATRVQDRVIRLEERVRLVAQVTPAEMAELDSLTTSQLIGLRFASNVELPDLARRAVREKLTRKQIKESIVSWRADNDRV